MFQREHRYIVLKQADVDACLTPLDQYNLGIIMNQVNIHRAKRNAAPLKCVVVEHDWPEYEPTWNAIEKRVENSDD